MCTCIPQHDSWRSQDRLGQPVLFFHSAGSGDPAQVILPHSQHLYLLNHLTSTKTYFSKSFASNKMENMLVALILLLITDKTTLINYLKKETHTYTQEFERCCRGSGKMTGDLGTQEKHDDRFPGFLLFPKQLRPIDKRLASGKY